MCVHGAREKTNWKLENWKNSIKNRLARNWNWTLFITKVLDFKIESELLYKFGVEAEMKSQDKLDKSEGNFGQWWWKALWNWNVTTKALRIWWEPFSVIFRFSIHIRSINVIPDFYFSLSSPTSHSFYGKFWLILPAVWKGPTQFFP